MTDENSDIKPGFDQEMYKILNDTFKAALLLGSSHSPEQIKLMIVATNLESLASMFLLADESPELAQLDFKKVALGLMGTGDWVREGLNFER